MILKTGKRVYFKSLAATLVTSFSVLILIALLTAGSLQMYLSYNTQKSLLLANQELIANKTANTVENTIHEKYNLLAAASKHRDLTDQPKDEQKLSLERLMGIEPAFRQIALFNSDKIELARVSRLSRSLSPRLIHYNHDELFKRTGRREIYTGSVYIDEMTRMPMMAMAVPVTDIFGDYKGTLIAEVNLKFLWDLMHQIKIGESGQAYIVEKQGYLIAYREIGRILKREKLAHLQAVDNFISGETALNERSSEISKGILDTKVITTHVKLETLNWAVIVELPVMEAYQPIIMTLILSVLAMFFSIILAVISGVYLSKRLTKPIIELRDATEKIGKGQLSLNIDIKGSNEINDLASSFNMMIEDLRNTTVSRDILLNEVNERKNAEKNLIESEQKMKAILMASPIGIGLVNNNRLEWANDSLFYLTGYNEKSLLGQNISILFLNETQFKKAKDKFFSDPVLPGKDHVETQCIQKDGTVIDCIVGFCFLDMSDPAKGEIITLTDISESKQLQSKLLQAQKLEAIGTLSAGVAHDLNNILGGIMGYPDLLLMDMPDNDSLRDPLMKIRKAGEKASAIVKDLLTMARRGVALNEILNMNDVIYEFLKSPEYENILKYHPGTEVKTALQEGLPNVLGSSVKIAKVLMNLISNAAESMCEGGEINITTQNQYLEHPVSGYENIDKGDYVKLTVSDTGEGISKADLRKIFEPFFTKKKMGRSGTGLGMTVVWGTVKDHNGYIDVESSENTGTSFTLYFPVCRSKVEEKPPLLPLQILGAKGESIVIVDDVEEQRLMLAEILEKLGYKVKTVPSGEEAVRYMQNSCADLLVLDMIMEPGINGLETYRRILNIHPNQKAIIASGFSETEHVREAIKLGAGAYIQKPFSFQEIGQVIRDVLDK